MEFEISASGLQAPGLSLPFVIGYGLLDSINPCVIGVLLVMLTVLLKTGDRMKILKNGLAYTAGVYIVYLLGGITFLSLFNAVRSIEAVSQMLYLVIGAFVIIAGLLEVKDFFWYGRWFSLAIPKSFLGYVEKKIESTHTSLYAALSFGAAITLIELPCTGAPYLAVLTLMSQGGLGLVKGLQLLILYNTVFILPLLVIIGLVYYGFGVKRLEGWKQEHRGTMRLAIGVALIAVGIWVITAVADYLLIPLIGACVFIFIAMAFGKYVLQSGRDWPG